MPVIANAEAREIPWRPGYRSFILAGEAEGLRCVVSQAVLEPGAGAPLHLHAEADEVLMVLEGCLDVRLGEERRLVGAGHTIAVPAGTPHAFTATGPGPARFVAFLPKLGVFLGTTYLEGEPPTGVGQRDG